MYFGKGYMATQQHRTASCARWYKPFRCQILVWAVIILTAGGCTTVGPDFVKPDALLQESWIESQSPGLQSGQTDYSSWWRVFDDPVLDDLIDKAYRQNLSLQVAGIRIYEARAQLGVVVGNLYPQQQAGFGELTTNKRSVYTDSPMADTKFTELSLGFDAAWELDIWGKYRRSVQSGVANLEATVATYDNILVSLTAEVARTYIAIRTLEKRLIIAAYLRPTM